MRRLRQPLGIFLLLFFSLPAVAPLLALSTSARLSLPACCRRGGTHRCSLKAHAAAAAALNNTGSGADRRTARLAADGATCPLFPAALPSVTHADTLAAPPRAALYAELASHPATRPQTRACARIALGRSRPKRGPPATTLL